MDHKKIVRISDPIYGEGIQKVTNIGCYVSANLIMYKRHLLSLHLETVTSIWTNSMPIISDFSPLLPDYWGKRGMGLMKFGQDRGRLINNVAFCLLQTSKQLRKRVTTSLNVQLKDIVHLHDRQADLRSGFTPTNPLPNVLFSHFMIDDLLSGGAAEDDHQRLS